MNNIAEIPKGLPPLGWAGLVLLAAGQAVEGVVTGTIYEQRFPNAALICWLVMLIGTGLLLLGYSRQIRRAGLPRNRAFVLWAAAAMTAYVVGWSNLRGAIHGFDKPLRDELMNGGLAMALICVVAAVVAGIRWLIRLPQEQQAFHFKLMRTWAVIGLITLIAAWAVSAIVWYRIANS